MASQLLLARLLALHSRPEPRGYAELPSLEPVLAELLASARAAWPRVRLEEAVFLRLPALLRQRGRVEGAGKRKRIRAGNSRTAFAIIRL